MKKVMSTLMRSVSLALLLCTLLTLSSVYAGAATEYIQKKNAYDRVARQSYSENDVKAFVYQWFAGFDHQAPIEQFKKHLDPEQVVMNFPDFPIRSMADFERWYGGVIDSIQWNSHQLSNLQVSGDEKSGFEVSLHVNWKARTYQGESYDLNIAQEWSVTVDEQRRLIISHHSARML